MFKFLTSNFLSLTHSLIFVCWGLYVWCGQCKASYLGILKKYSAYSLFSEDSGGPEKDLLISSCPEKGHFTTVVQKRTDCRQVQ